MIFFDFEVFRFDWLCVAYDTYKREKHIIVNDRDSLESLYSANKDNIFVGYNCKGYDQYILKGILLGLNPYKISKHIIDGKYGWEFSKGFNKIDLNVYDCSIFTKSLKELEGNMGLSIKESTVSFDIDRKLTEEEMKEVINYCVWDVESTIEVFLHNKKEFDSHISLLKTFNLPSKYFNKTKAQLSAIILEAEKCDYNDEFQLRFPDTIILKKPEYQEMFEWYTRIENQDYSLKQEVSVAGIPTVLGWGGIHGSIDQYQDEGILVGCDISSMYPAIMINYDFLSRTVRYKSKYRSIRDERLRLKAIKDPKQEPMKIVLRY